MEPWRDTTVMLTAPSQPWKAAALPFSYDLFIASLTCPGCKAVSLADDTTNMQTYLPDATDRNWLTVGTALRLEAQRIQQGDYDGYYSVRTPELDEPIRILHTWECPSCGNGFNWAEVVVREGVIESITAIEFDREHFERSHLVSHDAISIAAELTGKPFTELMKSDVVRLLRDTL